MIIVKGLVVAALAAIAGVVALTGSAGPQSSSDAATAAYYPDATLPTLFLPMRH